MTIASSNRKTGPFAGNGSSIQFSFTFKVFSASDLLVVKLNTTTGVETELTPTTDYTVLIHSDQNNSPGGTITLTTALATGYDLTITSSIDYLQGTDLTNRGGFYPSVITDALDRACIQIQQVNDKTDRSIKYPLSDTSTGSTLPTAQQRAGKVLAFDDNGDPIAGPSVSGSGGSGSGGTFVVGVSDEAYGSSWDGITETAPSKNAVYDKLAAIDALSSQIAHGETAYGWGNHALAGYLKSAPPGGVIQTVQSAFTDVYGRNDALYNGQVDFAPLMDTSDAISGGDFSGYPAYQAFDGSDSTAWVSSQAYTSISGVAYIGMKNLKRNIKGIKFLSHSSTGNNLSSIKLQYSQDNGLTWNDIQTSTLNTAASTWTEIPVATYASDNAGLHAFRVLANASLASGYNWYCCSLILLYNSNLDVCTTGNAICYSYNASYPAMNAFDNTWGTYYQTTNYINTGNEYLGQSGLTSAVKAIRLSMYNASCKEIRLSWKQSSGDAWIDLATVSMDGNYVTTGQANMQTIAVPAYSPSGSHYFAIRPTTNNSAVIFGVYEMEFYCGDDTDLKLTASVSDPFVTTFAAGISASSNSMTTASSALLGTSLAPGRTHFAYQDRAIADGTITHGKTSVVPQYGFAFDSKKHTLLHCDGTSGSTNIVDEFGATWSCVGNAQISNGGQKFGTGKIILDGSGSYIKNTTDYFFNGKPFTIEFWWYTANNATANQILLGSPVGSSYDTSSCSISYNAGAISWAYAATTSGWDIGYGTYAVTAVNNTWYKCILEWDGYYYRLWHGTATANMILVGCVKSSTPIYMPRAGISFGGNTGYYLTGGLDEIRITLGSNRYGWSPVAETAAFPKYDADIHFFDRTRMKMYKGNDGTGWTECQRVFLGEAYMDAHGVTILDNYTLNGVYESLDMACPVNNVKTTFRHRLGFIPRRYSGEYVNYIAAQGYLPGQTTPICIGNYSSNWGYGMGNDSRLVGSFFGVQSNSALIINRTNGQPESPTAAYWRARYRAERGW